MAVKKVITGLEPNTNVLKGIACPSCGYTDSFAIECAGVCEVTDDGVESPDVAWDDSSFIRCGDCGHEGVVGDFVAPKESRLFSGQIQVDKIDLELLKEQKAALIDAIGDDVEDELLIGLLNFVDHIQDQIYMVRGYSFKFVCSVCGESHTPERSYDHHGRRYCDNCWDERLRSTE